MAPAGTGDGIAGAALLLASNDSSSATGEVFVVDGRQSARPRSYPPG